MSELHDAEQRDRSKKQYITLVTGSVFLVLIGAVGFIKYLENEIVAGHLSISQSIIIFLFEAVAVLVISKALKHRIEKRKDN